MNRLAEMLRQGADRLVELPNDARRFMTNPQAFTQLLTGNNPMPRETGFAAGAMSLPPTEMSVLDPNQAPYMQGYDQGEPFGIAAMALPFAAPAAVATAKALAPKAGMMAENYMVKQGMIQPLTAYHGTPHTIQGQFDINKVGTGEGAQAYGHGMYFAENPAVAKAYALTIPKNINKEAYDAENIAKRLFIGGFDEKYITNRIKSVLPNADDKIIANAVETAKTGQVGGNLYKVDIPDEYIPTMMDYDKPLGQQSAVVKKALNEIKKQITPEMKMELGGDMNLLFGKDVTPVQFLNTMEIIHPTGGVGIGEKMLNDLGVKGIRYLDQGSRNPGFSSLTPTQLQARIESLQTDIKSGGGNQAKMKEQLKALQNEMDSYKNMTSNFVVFEPSNVKILEQNSKPVTRKEILEQQINKIE